MVQLADFNLACAPKADVLAAKPLSGEPAFLIRLREDGGARTTYHLRRYSDFQVLDKRLRQAVLKRTGAQAGAIESVPDFPTNGKFGIRRSLSKLGMSSFSRGQLDALQRYLSELLWQIPSLAAERDLQQFFKDMAPADVARLPQAFGQRYQQEQDVLKEMLFELRGHISVKTIQGYWRLDGSEKIWQIDPCGRSFLDGTDRGEEYHLTESGTGSARVIDRPDGWCIDIEKSTEQRLLWVRPDQPLRAPVVWIREDPDVAQAQVEKLIKVRERLQGLGAVMRASAGA